MTVRVMWLLNHGAARKFDLMMLRVIGIEEIFTPKNFPQQMNFRSASIDFSTDAQLTIPQDELKILNQADWYREPGDDAWNVANKYFKVLFFIAHDINLIRSVSKNFHGAIIWRAFGLDQTMSYTKIVQAEPETRMEEKIKLCGNRFWMGNSYPHLPAAESSFLAKKAVYLPLGMTDCSIRDSWSGKNKSILFICPDIGFNTYYQKVYKEFIRDFKEFNYAIGGAQPVAHSDHNVLGYVPLEVHQHNMREFRVMFYHSTEPNHIQYHPFEAICAGMPLVFMAGGMLDRMGGIDQPGRCKTIDEARNKIHRILNDDLALIEDIRKHQVRLLDLMRPENCEQAWRDGFKHILNELELAKAPRPAVIAKPRKRIAVIVPIGYRGGSLRGAKMLAHALWEGSRQANENADVVLAHLDEPATYPDEEFDDLHPAILRRQFSWKSLNPDAARRAMRYAGYDLWEPSSDHYCVPNDDMQQFLDCDLWVVISDRLGAPLLPVRPYVCMVYDYLQRYETILPHGADQSFLNASRLAQQILVTTKFTEQDALQYAGIHPDRLARVPMLAPVFKQLPAMQQPKDTNNYFLWTTNASPHKNHLNAMLALKEYYEILDGKLECRVSGVNTKNLLKSRLTHMKPVSAVVSGSRALRSHLRWLGELSDASYQQQLAGASFLWHAGRIDNGTFSVVEAAHLRVPSLSSDYPAMQEINTQFQLNLTWMDASKPKLMAKQLKWMEENASIAKTALPSKDILKQQSIENLALDYWKAVRKCL